MHDTGPSDNRPPSPWHGWSRWRLLLLAGTLVAGNFAWQLVFLPLGAGPYVAVIAGSALGVGAPLALLVRTQGWSPARDLGLDRPAPAVLVLAALMALAGLVPTALLARVSAELHPIDPAWAARLEAGLPDGPVALVLTVISVVIAAPVAEELIFRGFIHRLAAATWGPLPAIAVSSVVFGLIHGQPWFVFGLIGVGMILAFIHLATRSVTACIVAHAVHNGVSLAMMLDMDEMVTEPAPLSAPHLLLAAGSLVALVALGRLILRFGRPGRSAGSADLT